MDFEVDETCLNHLDMAMKWLIIDALQRHDWEQKGAAHYLGITARSLNYYVKKFRIRHHRWGKNHGRNIEEDEES